MAPDLHIRDFAESDLPAVMRLNIRAMHPDTTQEAIDEITARAYRDLLNVKSGFADGAFLVGLIGDELAAMAATHRRELETFEMHYVRVDRAHQRRGFGRQIVTAVEERAPALGCSLMVLDTTIEQIDALRLYGSLGYKSPGRTVLENEHGRFDLVLYEKRL
jgi:GNAT superfamily N-acetyltransferase